MSKDLIPYDDEIEDDDDNKQSEEEKARVQRFLLIAVIVLIVIVAVLTFGWFYWKKQKEEEKRKKAEEKKRKKERLKEIEARINVLQATKERIERRERIIKLWVRIGIGLILILVNLLYARNNFIQFDFDSVSSKLLNLNAVILTGYSFIAFVSYGSIENFVKRMKEILADALRRKHLTSLAELESLLKEREILIKEIVVLENETVLN